MGTAEFAVPTLEAVINSNHQIAAVITQPDRPFGRGLKLRPSPVKQTALQHQLLILSPESIKEQNSIAQLRQLNPEVIVVVAYGKILPPTLLDIPKFGCINVHGSLLPKYRGAAPIQWTLIRGETETGVTTMFMNERMDEGDIIYQEKIGISPDDNYGTLSVKLALLGAQLLIKTLSAIQTGNTPRISQNHQEATYAPKIQNNDGLINWNQSTLNIVNLIRGVTPVPGAYTTIHGKRIRILTAKVGLGNPGTAIGRVILVGKHDEAGILVQSGNKTAVQIMQIQPESGKIMTAAQFARGHKVNEGMQFGI